MIEIHLRAPMFLCFASEVDFSLNLKKVRLIFLQISVTLGLQLTTSYFAVLILSIKHMESKFSPPTFAVILRPSNKLL